MTFRKFEVGETGIHLYVDNISLVFADRYGHERVYCDKHTLTQLRLDLGDPMEMVFCWKCVQDHSLTEEEMIADLSRYAK